MVTRDDIRCLTWAYHRCVLRSDPPEVMALDVPTDAQDSGILVGEVDLPSLRLSRYLGPSKVLSADRTLPLRALDPFLNGLTYTCPLCLSHFYLAERTTDELRSFRSTAP